MAAILALTSVPELASSQEEPEQFTLVTEVEVDQRYIERVVDFMWVEGRYNWTDTFTARVYPRHPVVGSTVRIRLRIKRKRDGRTKGKAAPIKIEALVRPDKGGKTETYEAIDPGNSAAFEHTFSRPGLYIVSIVTHYSEKETYTTALRVVVEKAPPPEPIVDEE